MKALTIWQPWATLIALGLKQYETRSWKTGHRGDLAIHAAKRWGTKAQREVAHRKPLPTVFERLGYETPPDLPRGKVLCVCELEGVHRAERLQGHLSEWERGLGDFSPERFGWRLSVEHCLYPQIEVRGRQGLWMLPLSVREEIAVQRKGHTRYA